MADGVGEVGAVQGVKVDTIYAFLRQAADLVGGQGDRHELTNTRLVVEAIEGVPDELRYGRSRLGGELRRLVEVRNRHNSGDDRHMDPGAAGLLAEAEEAVV